MAAAAPEMAIAVAPAEEDVDLMTEMAIDMPAAATVVEDLVSMEEAESAVGASAEDVTSPAAVTVLEAMSPTMEEAAAVVSVPLATTDVKEVEEVAIATEAVALETTAPLIGSTELEVVVVVVVTMISTTASDTFRMAMTRTLPRRATSPRTNMTF